MAAMSTDGARIVGNSCTLGATGGGCIALSRANRRHTASAKPRGKILKK